jgi:hypothetical protein
VSDVVAVCLDGDAQENWRECADILYSRSPRPPAEAFLLAQAMLARYPGCVLAVVATSGDDCATRVRGAVIATAAVGPRVDADRSR